MTATLTFRKKKFEVKSGMTLRDAIKKLDILPESVIPVKDGEPITDDIILEDGDQIKLVRVISGG
jgi:sulfur carrier protein ThiS